MQWITSKQAAEVVGRSVTTISRFIKKYSDTKHIKRSGRSVLIDKDFLLSSYNTETITEETKTDEMSRIFELEKEVAELQGTIDFMLSLQAKTEIANEALLKSKDETIELAKVQNDRLLDMISSLTNQNNVIALEQIRAIKNLKSSNHTEIEDFTE